MNVGEFYTRYDLKIPKCTVYSCGVYPWAGWQIWDTQKDKKISPVIVWLRDFKSSFLLCEPERVRCSTINVGTFFSVNVRLLRKKDIVALDELFLRIQLYYELNQ